MRRQKVTQVQTERGIVVVDAKHVLVKDILIMANVEYVREIELVGKIEAEADAARALPDAGGAVVRVVITGNVHIERWRYFVAVNVCVVTYAGTPVLPIAVIAAIIDFGRCAIRRTRQLRMSKLASVLGADVWDPEMNIPMVCHEIRRVKL